MYLIINGKTVTRRKEDPFIENGAVAVSGDRIVSVGDQNELSERFPDAERIDAKGGVIMPGLIDAHTHLYKSFMRGMPRGEAMSEGYYASLTDGIWRYDRTFEYFDTAYSALAGAVEYIRNGVTSVFDHHAGYGSVSGSLYAIAGMISAAGIRASLSYDVSQRCGFEACCEAVDESAGFIDYCESESRDRIKAMFGLGESFALYDIDLDCCARKNTHIKPFHIHVSEGPDDRIMSLHNYGLTPVERLVKHGVLTDGSILAGCSDLRKRDMDAITGRNVFVVTDPLSDMMRALDTADVFEMMRRGIVVGLGTDGETFDPLENARAFIASQRKHSGGTRRWVAEAAKMLFENNRLIAERSFGKGIGTLSEGVPADVVIMDYDPFTRMDKTNYDEHIVFGMSGRCSMTMVAGKLLMRDRKLIAFDRDDYMPVIRKNCDALWKRLSECGSYEWSRIFAD